MPKKDLVHFDLEIQKVNWNDLSHNDGINQFCTQFIDTIKNVMDKFDKKMCNKNKKAHLPWLTDEIWNLMKRRDYLLKKVLKTGIDTDMRLFKDCRNKVVRQVRNAKANFFIELITQAKGNNQLVWKHIKEITRKEKCNKTYEININHVLTHEENEVANTFNMYFRDSAQELAVVFGNRIREVSEQEVLKILKNSK